MNENKILAKLALKEFKLNSLLEITKAINENYSVDRILQIYEYIIRDQLGISKLILYVHDKEWDCLLKFGFRGKPKDISVEDDLLNLKEITVIESSSKQTLNSFDVVIPVFHKDKPLAFLLIGDLNEDEIALSPTIKHMPFIQTLTNVIVVAIENKRFAKKAISQERTRRELELAAEIQSMLFPQDLQRSEHLDVSAQYITQQLVGGDYYDLVQVSPDEWVLCMADVSGKGASAALLMSNFQAHLRAILDYTSFPLKRLVQELNKRVMASANGEKFITFFVAKYNTKSRKLEYINAGHNHPILRTENGVFRLGKGSTGLGMFDELPFIDQGEVEIPAFSHLVLFTDGLVEIENEKEEAFESESLEKLIVQNKNLSSEELNASVFEELDRFKGAMPYIDDTAILSCIFK